MRFAMIAPYQGTDPLASKRDELTLFNVDVVTFGLSSTAERTYETAARFDCSVERVLDDLVFHGPWDGTLVAVTTLIGGPAISQDAVEGLARRIRDILGRQVPIGVVDNVNVDLPQQLFDGIMALWFLRVLALDAADRTLGR